MCPWVDISRIVHAVSYDTILFHVSDCSDLANAMDSSLEFGNRLFTDQEHGEFTPQSPSFKKALSEGMDYCIVLPKSCITSDTPEFIPASMRGMPSVPGHLSIYLVCACPLVWFLIGK